MLHRPDDSVYHIWNNNEVNNCISDKKKNYISKSSSWELLIVVFYGRTLNLLIV